MAMQFNPNKAFLGGMDLNSPVSSQGGINQLLGMQQNTLGNVVDTIGNIGKTSRTNTVNDLIARGGLEGLNEAQAQAKIAQMAKGSLTPEGQAQVDKILQTVARQDEQKFRTGERIAGQEFNTSERLGRQTFDNEQRLGTEDFTDKQRRAGEKFKEGQSALDRQLTEKEGKANRGVQLRGQYKEVQGSDGMLYNATPEGKLIPLVKGLIPNNKDGSGSGSRSKENDIFKLTGAVKTVYDGSSAKGKLALQKMYETGDLQGVDILGKPDEHGVRKITGQKLYYKGQPMTVAQLKKQVGLK